jgi:hypothetical protein
MKNIGGRGIMVNHASDEDACPEEHRDEGSLLSPTRKSALLALSPEGRSIAPKDLSSGTGLPAVGGLLARANPK